MSLKSELLPWEILARVRVSPKGEEGMAPPHPPQALQGGEGASCLDLHCHSRGYQGLLCNSPQGHWFRTWAAVSQKAAKVEQCVCS